MYVLICRGILINIELMFFSDLIFGFFHKISLQNLSL